MKQSCASPKKAIKLQCCIPWEGSSSRLVWEAVGGDWCVTLCPCPCARYVQAEVRPSLRKSGLHRLRFAQLAPRCCKAMESDGDRTAKLRRPVAVKLNVFFNPKVLYFIRLGRKSSLGVQPTQFWLPNSSFVVGTPDPVSSDRWMDGWMVELASCSSCWKYNTPCTFLAGECCHNWTFPR